jgi:hypothetical protein
LRLANLVQDEALLFRAKEIVGKILDEDPELQQPQHQHLARIAVQSDENGTNLAS